MQIMKIIIKAGIGLAAAIFAGGDLLFKIGIFGVVYGFLTYYLWFFGISGSEFIIKIFAPFIPAVIFALILNSLPLGEIAEAVGSWLIVIVSYICVALDARKVIHLRNGEDI